MPERKLFAVQFPTDNNFLDGINSILPKERDGVLIGSPIMVIAPRVIVVGENAINQCRSTGIPHQEFPVSSLEDLSKEEAQEIHSLHHQEFLRGKHLLETPHS